MTHPASIDIEPRHFSGRAADRNSARAVSMGVIAALVVGLGVRVWHALWPYATASPRFPNSDGASHVMLGIQMADALRRGNVVGFLRQIYECSPWPPLYFVAEVPFFLMFGNHYHVAAAMTTFQLVGCIVGIFAIGVAMDGAQGMMIGAIAAALMAASPMVQAFGSLIMLEVPGTFVLVLAMIAAVRYRRTESLRDARLACIATLALFMLKYNFGILWIASLVVSEIGHSVPTPRRVWDAVLRFVHRRRWLSPLGLGVAIAVLVLGFLATHRGAVLTLAGRRWVVPGLRDPVLVVLALALIVFLSRARDNIRRVQGWFTGLHPAARSFLAIVALPSAVWLAFPIHMKEFLEFLENRSSDLPLLSAQNLLFYPRSFVQDYSPSVVLGISALGLAVVSILRIPKLPPTRRLAPVALAVGLAFTTVHRFKEIRFFFLVAPLVWLSCGIAIADLLARLTRDPRARTRTVVTTAAAGVTVLASAAFGLDSARLRAGFVAWTASGWIEPVLRSVTDVNVSSRGTVLIGTWDRLAPHLVWWYQRYHHPDARGPSRPKNPLWYSERFVGNRYLIDTNDVPAVPLIDKIAADRDVERVIVLNLPPDSPIYWSRFDVENAWAHPVRAMIAGDPRFHLETSRRFPDSRYEMSVYGKQ